MAHVTANTCLYFGTFNPIHSGHLMIAQAALRQFLKPLGLNTVAFIPAGNPPHRHHEEDLLDAWRRYKMVELAIASNPAFTVLDIELQRAERNDTTKRSYTIDTLQYLIQHQGLKTPAPMIIGADALAGLASWHKPEELIQAVHFLQAPRPGHPWVESITIQDQPFPIITSHIEMPALSLSSSWIRSQLRTGTTSATALRYFLPEPVRQYIHANQLYKHP
jgi:nicotinate-nucleotide adenylyltransferase